MPQPSGCGVEKSYALPLHPKEVAHWANPERLHMIVQRLCIGFEGEM